MVHMIPALPRTLLIRQQEVQTCLIDLMHDDVTRPERQYVSCSHAQIQDGRQ